MKRLTAGVVALVAVAGVAASVAATPSPAATAPSAAVRFPAGFTTPIWVGATQVWPAVTTGATTSTTSPATTNAPSTSTTTTTPTSSPASTSSSVPPTTQPSTGSACGLPSPAFCETFDQPHNGGTQTGDLDSTLWGVSRAGDINPPQGELSGMVASTNPCSSSSSNPGFPPADVRVCNGQMVESVNDGHMVVNLDTYPKQPFNFAARTGRIVFDVSADSDGTHGAWPEVVITDKPVPGTRSSISFQPNPAAANEIGFSLAGGTAGPGGVTGVDSFFTTSGGVYSLIAPTQYGTVTKGSPAALNHFEVDVSTSRIDVYATQPGDTALVHLAGADLALTFTQGLVWLNDVHYNARKAIEPCECGTQFDHAFTWDNLGFDGPKTYRDWGFDVPYSDTAATSQFGEAERNGGYNVGAAMTLAITGVAKGAAVDTPARLGALVVFNGYAFTSATITITLNGHVEPAVTLPVEFAWQSLALPVSVADVVDGANTLTFATTDGTTTVANLSLILVAAAPVP